MNKTDLTYSIGTVAKMAGIPKYKLRHWCNRYLTHIERIRIGDSYHRRFTERDIDLIKRIKDFREKGFTLDAAVEQARRELKKASI